MHTFNFVKYPKENFEMIMYQISISHSNMFPQIEIFKLEFVISFWVFQNERTLLAPEIRGKYSTSVQYGPNFQVPTNLFFSRNGL